MKVLIIGLARTGLSMIKSILDENHDVTVIDKSHEAVESAMDKYNIRNMHRFFGDDPENKVSLLLSWANEEREVADPWYTGNFEATWLDVNTGCQAMLKQLL